MSVDEYTIHLDDSPVFYRRTPATAAVPALYLHGIPTSSDDWATFLKRVGGIAPDLIGFGRSGKGGHLDYTPAGLARFVERLLDDVDVDAVNLVAHDWGAAAGLTFARREPDRVHRVVLCNPPPLLGEFTWPLPLRLFRTPVLGELVMGAVPRTLLARTLRRGSARDGAWPDARIAAVWEQFDQGTQRAILRLVRSGWEEMVAAGSSDRGGVIGAGNGSRELWPTLIIWGDRDPWYPVEVGSAYAAGIPGARLERLPDAGHWPWLDRDDVVDRVAGFLAGS